jgi:hypothetical protein
MSEDNTITVLDLLNLSLGTPEIGAVNFNLLHRFLLELVKHFSIARKQIDITDDICIQSALEESRMLSGTKSQTYFLAHSSLSEQADGKRLSESRTQDSSAVPDGGKRKTPSEKPNTTASGAQDKDSINEMVRPDEGSSRAAQVIASKEGYKESLQTEGIPAGSGDVQGIEASGSKGDTGKMTYY